MTNPTDTNQASEEELELIVARISAGIGGFGKLTSGTRYDGISEEAGIELLKAYIRTEKLKLLAEVRERVIGEDEDTRKWEDPIDRQVASECNQLRAEQRARLTKLEAEL